MPLQSAANDAVTDLKGRFVMSRRSRNRAEVSADIGPTLPARLFAEAAGTFMLVFGVVGAALLAATFGDGREGLNVGFLGVAFALGLSVLAGAFAFANVSGAHFNPAVTVGMAVAGRFPWRWTVGYILAQLIGGLLASSLLAAIAAGGPGDFLGHARAAGFASTGWGELSPGHFTLTSAIVIELVATGVFVWVVLGATAPGGADKLAPVAVGLTLTLVALIAIPVSNGSFNPARSVATAVWGGDAAMAQLWMSLLAPTIGGVLAGVTFHPLFGRQRRRVEDHDPSD
jgi:aquaporin Z